MTDERQSAEQVIATLRVAYRSFLPQRLDRIESTASVLKPGTPVEEACAALGELHGPVHDLAGSAGIYGLTNLSKVARLIEFWCLEVLLEKGGVISVQKSAEFDLMIELLRHAATADSCEVAATPLLVDNRFAQQQRTGQIIVVEEDRAQAEALEDLLGHLGFETQMLSQPSELGPAIASSQPRLVLMDSVFHGDPDAGLRAVRELRSEGVLTCPAIFLSVRDDFQARLEAARAGGDGYVLKPLNMTSLIATIDRLIVQRDSNAPHILIVVDDSQTATCFSQCLQDAGANTEAVTDPLQAIAALRRFAADLILLDVNMPQCNGFDLATVIRQASPNFQNIPIVFLTNETGIDQRTIAIRQGGDDFLEKTVAPTLLVSSVLAKAERSQKMNEPISDLNAAAERFDSITRMSK